MFDRLREAGLTIKPSKCQIAADKVKYLGHILSRDGVAPNPEKVKIIENYAVPKNVKQVRQFLGLTNYYRRFQKNYSKTAKVLQNLTQKATPFVWTDECQKAFDTLRNNLMTEPVLAYPDLNRPFILTTDVSDVAISYILSQKDAGGVEHPIAFSGRALRKAEMPWTTTEKEGLAIICGFKHFHPYLISNKTTVVTDHNALVYIKNIQI